MTAAHFLISSQRHNTAAAFGNNIFQYRGRLCAFVSVCIQGPSLRKRFVHLIVHFQLSSGYHRGRTVKEERIGVCRHSYRNGIGAQHGFFPESRHHNRFGIGAGHSQQSLVAGHLCVVAGNSKVVGFSYCHNTDSRCLRFFNRLIHGKNRNQLSHTVVSVNHCRNRCFKHYLRFFLWVNRTFFNSFVIPHHTLHTVTFYSEQIRSQQYIFDFFAFLFTKSKSSEHIITKMFQNRITPFYISHNVASWYSIIFIGITNL